MRWIVRTASHARAIWTLATAPRRKVEGGVASHPRARLIAPAQPLLCQHAASLTLPTAHANDPRFLLDPPPTVAGGRSIGETTTRRLQIDDLLAAAELRPCRPRI